MAAEPVVLSEITTPGPPADPGPPIWHKFLASADAAPGSLALVSMHQRPDLYGFSSLPHDEEPGSAGPAYLRWSYATLKGAVARLVAGLQGAGVDEGTPVVSFVPLGAEGALALWAAEALDCVWIPLNARSLANATEITHMVRTALSVAPPGKTPLLLVEDAETAKRVDGLALNELEGATRVVVSDKAAGGRWAAFSGLVREREAGGSDEEVLRRGGHKSSFVVFTSGTTSLPKGVHATPLTHFERYLEAARRSPQFAGLPPPRALCAGPANHVPGRFQQVWPLCLGGAAVFAAPAFDLERTAEALVREKITHVTLVPTMVVALASELARPLEHLREVRVGSAGVSPAVFRACVEQLGADRVQVGYGMTEGLYIFSGLAPPEDLLDGDEVAVGWPEPGSTVKICNAETGETVPRGVPGVVHWTGPTAAREYIGGDKAGVCYQDDGGRFWLNTGDLGKIDHRGRLFLTGRQKDMIIRGGENISPAAMEAALGTDPAIAALRPLVVGAPDDIAGQVPVVVVAGAADEKVKRDIRGLVLAKMGVAYLPDDVVSLAELDLDDFPLNVSGKIQKRALEARVAEHRKALASRADKRDVATVVRQAWAKAIGLDPAELALDAPVASFADSITLMRVRAEIKRALGSAPSMVDILGAESIGALIELAEAQRPAASNIGSSPKREGPPGAEDMVHLALDADGSQLELTKAVVSKAISAHGLGWDDVEDVTPSYDYASIFRLRFDYDSFNFGYAYRVKNVDKQTLQRALESTLAHHRVLTSFLVGDPALLGGKDFLHAIMRLSRKYLDLIIHDAGEVATVDEFKALVMKPEYAPYPGPLARFFLYTIASTGETALLAEVSHSVMDGFSVDLFVEDLDQTISNPAAHPRRVDYKIWADNHFALRSSLPAQASVAWHAARLKDLKAHHAVAGYPKHSETRAQNRANKPLQGHYYTEHIPLAQFEVIRQRTGIQPSVVVKAAIALFNVRKTGYTHALFSSLESNRSRFSSFFPASVTIPLEGADVAGPVYVPVVDLIHVARDKSAEAFLRQLADEGTLLTRHAGAPWYALEEALGPEAGPLLPDVVAGQVYNWLGPIGGGGTFQSIEMLDAMVRPEMGIRVMGGEDRQKGEIFLWVDGDAYETLKEYKGFTEEVAALVRWFADGKNWEKKIGEVI